MDEDDVYQFALALAKASGGHDDPHAFAALVVKHFNEGDESLPAAETTDG